MVSITVEYQNALRCRAIHSPSSSELETDAPTDNEGKGERFSPTDLVATALGSCMLTIMGIVAARHGWELTGAHADVVKEMTSSAPRRIQSLQVVLRLPAALDAKSRKTLEEAALACPVHRSLHPDVDIPVRFLYDN